MQARVNSRISVKMTRTGILSLKKEQSNRIIPNSSKLFLDESIAKVDKQQVYVRYVAAGLTALIQTANTYELMLM